jgi:aminopeptidase N
MKPPIQTALFLTAFILAAPANTKAGNEVAPLELGTSLTLAQQRSKQLSNISYTVQFSIPQSSQDPIEGSEEIAFDVKDQSEPVVLDFQVPLASAVKSFAVNSKALPLEITQGHLLIPANALSPGSNVVSLKFQAGSAGFHRRDDFLYTLFVPNGASRTFPCFDQPDLKARFNLTLHIPKDWVAVAQGGVRSAVKDEEFQTVGFNPTLPTSTYLFAFAAGKFQAISRQMDGRTVTLYHRESDPKKVARNVDAIFELHAKSLAWLEKYTGIPYPYEKFDFVILPAFPFSGMEHPGSIFYNDKAMLLDESATKSQILSRAQLVAHETSHIWFGDLVTMRWFDDVWLKEVFANFMSYKIVATIFPGLDHDLKYLFSYYPAAYGTDRTQGTHAILQKLTNLNEAARLYGDIIYSKAPIVMRQLERLVGNGPFQEGLREYLREYKFGNATWADLIHIMGRHTHQPLQTWNDAWVMRAGRPSISLDLIREKSGVSIRAHSEDPLVKGRIWPQEFEAVLIGSDHTVRVPIRLDRPVVDTQIKEPPTDIQCILTAADNPGYGLFKLDQHSIEYLLAHLPDISDGKLRAVAWIDLWENMLEHRIKPEDYIDLAIKALPRETQELTLDYVLGTVKYSYWALTSDSYRAKVSGSLEGMLWTLIQSEQSTVLAKTSFFKAYLTLFTTSSAWTRIHAIWKGEQSIPGLKSSELDLMNMAYALSLRKPTEGPAIIQEQETRIKDPERKKEFKFVAVALSDSEIERDAFFQRLLHLENRGNEPWVRDALYYLHHPLRGAASEKYIGPSLELIPEIADTGGIFFLVDWLNGTLRYHVTKNSRASLDRYLQAHPELNPTSKLKLLQTSDTLMRFTSGSAGEGLSR